MVLKSPRCLPPRLSESRSQVSCSLDSMCSLWRSFCRHVNADVIRPRSQHIMALLLPNLRNISGEMLYLVLETLRAVLALDKNALNPQSTRELAEMVFATWLQNSTGKLPIFRGEGTS